MAMTNILEPAIDAVVERETVTFDFGLILQEGVTITSIVSVTCELFSGGDATPSDRLLGSPAIVASPSSEAEDAAVSQLVGDMIADCTYRLQCVANSSDGQRLSLWTRLGCEQPN